MGASLKRFCIAVQIVLWLVAYCCNGSDILICEGFTYYHVKKNGQATCMECAPCTRAGYGLNTTLERRENEHGFLSCYPCVRCPATTYREVDSREQQCTRCTLNCTNLHRYWSVPCGGANPGQCGKCKLGYTTGPRKTDGICHLRQEMSTTEQSAPITGTQIYDSAVQSTAFRFSYAVNIPIFLIIFLIVCTIVARRLMLYRKSKRRSPNNSVLPYGLTGVGLYNDLETDGDGHHDQVRARRELQGAIDELEAVVVGCGQEKLKTKRRDLKPLKMDRVLGGNDVTLRIVALNVSGEKRHELFHTYLKIEKSKTDQEQELWSSGAIPFSEYIWNLLKIWLQTAGKRATLETLCKSLKMAGFKFIVDMILDLPENQNTPCEEKDKDQTESMLDENTQLHGMNADENDVNNISLYNSSTHVNEDRDASEISTEYSSSPWAECIAQRDVEAADRLIKERMFPLGNELVQAFYAFGKTSKTFSNICNMICGYIKSTSENVCDTWASYRLKDLDEHGKVAVIVFVVLTKNLSAKIDICDYDTVFRCVSDYSEESDIVLARELMDVPVSITTEHEISEKLRKCISKHSDNLMDKHSKVSVISPSLKRSVGYGSENHYVLDEPCITLYVPVKGLIPIQEDPFPQKIDEYCVDVLEGGFVLFTGRANDFHDKLKMGLAIHANIVDNNGDLLAGTLGGFMNHPEHGLCGITCAHVVSTCNELIENGPVFCPNDRQVFQPVGKESKPFGNVVSIINTEGSESIPGMEVAVIKIQQRHPDDGSFPVALNYNEAGFDDSNPLTYNSGKVCEAAQIKRRTEVYKFGMESGVTRGSFGLHGSVLRKEEMKGGGNSFGYYLKNQMVILQIGEKHFAEGGDSGALVLIEGMDKDSVAIGLVEGGMKGRVFVTPICDILRALNGTCMSMKQFERTCSSIYMRQCESVSTDSGISLNEQMEHDGH